MAQRGCVQSDGGSGSGFYGWGGASWLLSKVNDANFERKACAGVRVFL